MSHLMERLLASHRTQEMNGLANHAHAYDAIARVVLGPLHDRVVADAALLAPPKGSVVVDVGSGPGRLAVKLARSLPEARVEGVDPSASMVDQARRNAASEAFPPHFREGDAVALPWADGSVALVVSTMSMHHWDDAEAGLRDIARVLSPGGRAMIYDPSASTRPALALATAAGLDARLDRLGFGLTRLTLRAAAS